MQLLEVSYSKNKALVKQTLIDYVEHDLAILQDDWDGHGACSIDKNVLQNTLYIFRHIPNSLLENVSKNDILPTPNGTITIEWHKELNEFLLEVGNKFSTYYIQSNGRTQKIDNQFDVLDKTQMQIFIRDAKQYILGF